MISQKKRISITLIYCGLILTPLLYNINNPIELWDEARNAHNAFEMANNGDLITTTYLQEPDLWNTKPPFLIWIQVFFIKIFGISEVSIRTPSILAVLGTCALLIGFSKKYFKKYDIGAIASIILIYTHNYLFMHSARTGNYDALLTFFTTAYVFTFFLFITNRSPKYLYLTFLCISLACLTKSIAGLMLLPGIAIYFFFYTSDSFSILKNKHFYIGTLIYSIIIGSYYFARELSSPGYLNAVYLNELGGRFLDTNEGHSGPLYYYVKILLEKTNYLWILLPGAIFIGVLINDKKTNQISRYLSIVGLTFLLIISISQTKLPWYSTPAYPIFSITLAIAVYHIIETLKQSVVLKSKFTTNHITIISLTLIFFIPINNVFQKLANNKVKSFVTESGLNNNIVHFNKIISDLNTLDKGHFSVYSHFAKSYNKEIEFVYFDEKNFEQLTYKDTVLAYDQTGISYMESNYMFKYLEQNSFYNIYQILDTNFKYNYSTLQLGDTWGKVEALTPNTLFIHPGKSTPTIISIDVSNKKQLSVTPGFLTSVHQFKTNVINKNDKESGEININFLDSKNSLLYKRYVTWNNKEKITLDVSNHNTINIKIDNGQFGSKYDWFTFSNISIK